VDGRPVDESTKSDNYEKAKLHLAKMNARKVRGELGGANAKLTGGQDPGHISEGSQGPRWRENVRNSRAGR
jgi:hypothetical protein